MSMPYFKQVLLATLIFAAVLPQAQSQVLDGVPHLINYQGRLTNPDGNPVNDGQYLITFTIWSDSTSASPSDRRWVESDCPVLVIKGLLNWQLGSMEPLPPWTMANDAALWLGIKVDDDPEISPRTRLSSAPYAYKAWEADYANYADSAGILAGNPPASGWVDEANVVRLETATDNVGIGVSIPSEKLDIDGTAQMAGFKMPTGAGEGLVLTSDAVGNGSWQAGNESTVKCGMVAKSTSATGQTSITYPSPFTSTPTFSGTAQFNRDGYGQMARITIVSENQYGITLYVEDGSGSPLASASVQLSWVAVLE